jgi:hypothetical protein
MVKNKKTRKSVQNNPRVRLSDHMHDNYMRWNYCTFFLWTCLHFLQRTCIYLCIRFLGYHNKLPPICWLTTTKLTTSQFGWPAALHKELRIPMTHSKTLGEICSWLLPVSSDCWPCLAYVHTALYRRTQVLLTFSSVYLSQNSLCLSYKYTCH